MAKSSMPRNVRCSFCGKTQDSVRRIVAGPGVYICDECIDLCSSIIEAEDFFDAVDKAKREDAEILSVSEAPIEDEDVFDE